MGKLAERLADGQRSGVYRVESTAALDEAVALNGFKLVRVALEGISGDALGDIAKDALAERGDGQVLLVSGFEAMMRAESGAFGRFMAQLQAAATAQREGELRFFAVFFDPAASLSLAPLYHWERSSSVKAV